MRFRPFVISLVVIAGSLSLIYAIVAPAIRHGNDSAHGSSCQSNLKQIALACSQYLEENDRRFPAISRGNRGWADVLATQSGARSFDIFHCPTVGKRDARNSDYFLNARLANLPRSQLKFPNQTISFGDGLARGGTNSHFSELPFDWKADEDSPAKRHRGANYAFVDGHVKWFKSENISTRSPAKNPDDWRATFAVR